MLSSAVNHEGKKKDIRDPSSRRIKSSNVEKKKKRNAVEDVGRTRNVSTGMNGAIVQQSVMDSVSNSCFILQNKLTIIQRGGILAKK